MPYPKLIVMVSFCWKINFLPSKIKKQIRFIDDVHEINDQSRCILSGPPCISNTLSTSMIAVLVHSLRFDTFAHAHDYFNESCYLLESWLKDFTVELRVGSGCVVIAVSPASPCKPVHVSSETILAVTLCNLLTSIYAFHPMCWNGRLSEYILHFDVPMCAQHYQHSIPMQARVLWETDCLLWIIKM